MGIVAGENRGLCKRCHQPHVFEVDAADDADLLGRPTDTLICWSCLEKVVMGLTPGDVSRTLAGRQLPPAKGVH